MVPSARGRSSPRASATWTPRSREAESRERQIDPEGSREGHGEASGPGPDLQPGPGEALDQGADGVDLLREGESPNRTVVPSVVARGEPVEDHGDGFASLSHQDRPM